MFRVSETASIDRSTGDVFDFVADLRNFPIWRANLASSTLVSEQPTDVGARCDEEIQVGPRKIPGTCQITSFSPGQSFLFQAVSPGLVYDGRFVAEPEADGSRITLSGEIRLSGFMRVLEPILKRRLQAGVESEVAAIKAHLEAIHRSS